MINVGILTAVGAFLGYTVASAFFWNFPHWLHKKKNISFTCAHISHRGGSAEGYENTIKNFRNAVEKGTNMLELDVRLTKDGQVVVFHDSSLLRVAGTDSNIANVDYDSLPSLSMTVPIDTVPGESFTDQTWSDEERRIPLLREVFEEFADVPINIDLKENDSRLIKEVSELINEFQRANLTVWGSFNNEVCKECYRINPDVRLFFSAKRVVVLLLCAFTGLLPFMPIKETHYEIFLPMSIKKRRLKQVPELPFSEKCLFWACETFLVWKPLINHLKNRGIHVYFWVCNDDDEFAECNKLGANGCMTDRPTLLREFLNTKSTE
ncbi:lysophospholipase D GDPD1-like isoform X2 [Bradysia coprophila]|uniref:lysophospholipase D GDPD1-like isoform X2 n=1 Tax=Bradysia coprophila TaxID=38358 RepID=UPI00187D9053|nr:lysophospholipase D GDPD1-like isoform X2 [Bradysia coprophila]